MYILCRCKAQRQDASNPINESGLWLAPSSIMPKKLINEFLEDCSIRGALKYTREDNSILAIRGQYLVPLVTIEVGYLQ